jgi:hypothetical protein
MHCVDDITCGISADTAVKPRYDESGAQNDESGAQNPQVHDLLAEQQIFNFSE